MTTTLLILQQYSLFTAESHFISLKMTTIASPSLPLNGGDAAHAPPMVFSLHDKITSITLFLLTPPFMVMMFALGCIWLGSRGMGIGVVMFTLWEYVTRTTAPEDLPSFWQTAIGTQVVGLIGAIVLGTAIGVAFAASYLLQRAVPAGVRKLGPPRALPYLSSNKRASTSWEYRGDKPVVICAGIVVGIAVVPVGYITIEYFGWEIKDLPVDPARPVLASALGALFMGIMEARRERKHRAEEGMKVADEAGEAANGVAMVHRGEEEEVLEKKDSVV